MKTKIIVCCIALAMSFAAGRYSVNKTTETAKTEQQTDKKEHTITTTVTVKSPNGEIKRTTVKDSTLTIKDQQSSITSKETIKNRSTINIALLGGYNFSDSEKKLLLGVSITKEVLGPVTVGVWALDNKTLGVSAGLNF